MNLNQYAIITRDYRVVFYNAANVKEAICQYASDVAIRIRNDLFEKAISTLNTSETVELFNQECWDWESEIRRILTGYQVLYTEDRR